ncbi:alpha-hydroxy acid oxidase [Polaromonas sp.]|uniref:alpha-hydroxy acid oxidase n=1 Tax=Polaromonas sp. TaxID=1869339 RepID=UPI0025E21122|nr:alpha-hydroxy acid oxidase [Polaromonas sp.]
MDISSAVSIADLESMARRRLPKVIFDYLYGGAEDEITLSANLDAFKQWQFKPRLVTGHVSRNLSVDLFGDRLSLPFLIGPTGLNGLHWKGADLALAQAAKQAQTVHTVSTASTNSLEDIAKVSSGPKWFQLYPWGDRAVVGRLIDRAKAAGYTVMMVTVDSLVAGKRERDARNKFSHEVHLTPRVIWDGITHPDWLIKTWFAGGGMPRIENVAEFVGPGSNASQLAEFTRSQRNAGLNWDDIAWMKDRWGGPFLVKGIACAEDVPLAKKAGADGVVVSNHGGRQLDGAPATLDVLQEVVQASGDNFPVLIDGGFRRGSDIIKALALGAKAILLGRATLYGLAAGGEPGVAKALSILQSELDRSLALLGCESVQALNSSWVRRVAK